MLTTLHAIRPDTSRAESGKTIEERYEDPDSIVVVVLSFERAKPPTPSPSGVVF